MNALAAGPEGAGKIVGRVGDQNEQGGLRRLLQGLENGIGRLQPQPVGLVDHKDAAPAFKGFEKNLSNQISHLADLDEGPVGRVASNIEVGPLIDFATAPAVVTEIILKVPAVGRFGQEVGQGSLADSRDPCKQQRRREAALGKVLPHQVPYGGIPQKITPSHRTCPLEGKSRSDSRSLSATAGWFGFRSGP